MESKNAEVEQLRAEVESLRARLEQQVRIAQYQSERFEFLTAALPHQVWTSLPSGQLDYVSPRVAEYFGRTAEQVIGDGWKDVVHPDDLAEVVKRWSHSLETGEPYQVEFRLRRRDGEYRWHMGRALAQRDAGYFFFDIC